MAMESSSESMRGGGRRRGAAPAAAWLRSEGTRVASTKSGKSLLLLKLPLTMSPLRHGICGGIVTGEVAA